MKKENIVSLASAFGGAAGFEIHGSLPKKAKKHIKAFYLVTATSIAAGLLANRFVPNEQPVSNEEYLRDVAKLNTKTV